MTLDKHKIEGIPQITTRTLPAEEFDRMLIEAGYSKMVLHPLKEIA